MELMSCLKCGQPLILKVTKTVPHKVSIDGSSFVDDAFFGQFCRLEEDIVCSGCGQKYPFSVDDKGYIFPPMFAPGTPRRKEL